VSPCGAGQPPRCDGFNLHAGVLIEGEKEELAVSEGEGAAGRTGTGVTAGAGVGTAASDWAPGAAAGGGAAISDTR